MQFTVWGRTRLIWNSCNVFLNHLDQVTLGNSLELHVEHPIKPFRPWLYPVDAAYLTQGRPNAYGSRLRYSFWVLIRTQLREACLHQNGWISGKFPKGGRGGSFPIQKISLQFFCIRNGNFGHEFPEKLQKGGGVKGRSKIFRKLIRFRRDRLPLFLSVKMKSHYIEGGDL